MLIKLFESLLKTYN